MIRRCLTIVLALLLVSCAISETAMHAVSVGKGDAIIISAGDEHFLIDTAKGYACGKIARAMEELGITHLKGVFITHVDSDHIEGLDWLVQSSITVENWYASPCFFEFKEKKHPLVKRDLPVTWLEAGDIVEFSAGKFTVLAPLSENPDEENDNSLVMMLETSDGRILLTGDMEFPEERELLSSGQDISCDILKVSNHGDGDASSPEFLKNAAPEIAVISTDSYEKPGTPAPEVIHNLEKNGAEVFVTEGADMVSAYLENGQVRAEYVYWEKAAHDGISLEIDVENELFTIENSGNEDVSLENWYIYSEKGNEFFIIPDCQLPSGGSVIIGTKSSPEGTYDVYWDDKNVLSDKKQDPVTLYDASGGWVSGW